MASTKKRKSKKQGALVRYLLDIARELNIDLSLASESETRRILNRLPPFSKQIVKDRHS